MRMCADLMSALTQFGQRAGVEHLAHHRAAHAHHGCAGIEAATSAMLLQHVGAIEGGLREIIEREGDHGPVGRDLGRAGAPPLHDAALHFGCGRTRWRVGPLHGYSASA